MSTTSGQVSAKVEVQPKPGKARRRKLHIFNRADAKAAREMGIGEIKMLCGVWGPPSRKDGGRPMRMSDVTSKNCGRCAAILYSRERRRGHI